MSRSALSRMLALGSGHSCVGNRFGVVSCRHTVRRILWWLLMRYTNGLMRHSDTTCAADVESDAEFELLSDENKALWPGNARQAFSFPPRNFPPSHIPHFLSTYSRSFCPLDDHSLKKDAYRLIEVFIFSMFITGTLLHQIMLQRPIRMPAASIPN